MPRKTLSPLKHIKTVKRNGVLYLYFNTGEKRDGKVVYAALGRADSIEFGTRYSAALAKRSRGRSATGGILLPELVRMYERAPEFAKKKSFGTQKTYSVYLRRIADEFDTTPAGGLDSSDIYKLMDDMANHPAAVDMLLLACGQMYQWAVKRKHVHRNPFAEVDREDWETQHYQPWPEDVIEEALADPRLGLPVALMYFTGQRIGDCCKMLWGDIESGIGSQPDTIYVKQQKTKKEVWPPIHSRLAEILVGLPHKDDATILTSPRGGKARHPTIREWIKDFGDERGLSLVPHGLRKNAVNTLLESECSTGEISSITGQSLKMVELYAAKRNTRKMGGTAMAKWERETNRETVGKTARETADL